jgi:NADH dehydrogenase
VRKTSVFRLRAIAHGFACAKPRFFAFSISLVRTLNGLRTVAIFGGTGFLGRRIVRHMLTREFMVRIVTRHSERSSNGKLETAYGDVNDETSINKVLIGAFAVVNAVSLYVEHESNTFQSVHVEAASRLARCSRAMGVARFVHVSGIGANPASSSSYIRSRGGGEQAVRAAFPHSVIIRPSVMFGPDDAFLMPLARLIQRLPIFPLFGRGQTMLQPAYVEDVAEAVTRILDVPSPAPMYELGGPHVYRYRELVQTIAQQLGTKANLMPVPFWAWKMAALVTQSLPRAPLTRNQVELMQINNVTSPELPGFAELGIIPNEIEAILAAVTSE